jgi:spermidine/putrescine transport system permease protein
MTDVSLATVYRQAARRQALRQGFAKLLRWVYGAMFLLYLYMPLAIVAALAFNDSNIPSFPWKGFTLDWFYDPSGNRTGIFNDGAMLDSLGTSLGVALGVTVLCLGVGTTAAFLFERYSFWGAPALYFTMIATIVIPGVILGVSLLSFGDGIIGLLRDWFGRSLVRSLGINALLRPGLFLVILGQFSFIGALATIIISGRLRRFPIEQEQAAMDLGATRFQAVMRVTVPYLMPALVSAGVVSFLTSFENFNTTLFLIGNQPTLPILFFSRLRFNITPEINAVSVLLMTGAVSLGLLSLFLGRSLSHDDR